MEKTLYRPNSEDSTVKTLSGQQLLVSISNVQTTKFQICVKTNMSPLWSRVTETETRQPMDQNPWEASEMLSLAD